MRDKRLIVGAVAVAFLMAGTRWASYIGVPPLFLTDALLALALALCAGTVAAAPKDDLHQAYSRFLAARSFRASVTRASSSRMPRSSIP